MKRLQALFGDRTAGSLDLVAQRGALLDQLGAQADEGADLLLHPAGGLPARQFGVTLLAIAGEPSGIDAVGFAERAARADEGLDRAGIGTMRRHPRHSGGHEQGGLIATGRLADHQGSPGAGLGRRREERRRCWRAQWCGRSPCQKQ